MSNPDPDLPKTLGGGRYVLGERIGVGGTSIVVRATDTLLGVPRAIKLLVGLDPSVRSTLWRRMKLEAHTMAALQHPCILAVHDLGEEEDVNYIVMDLAEGGSIDDILGRNGYIPVPDALSAILSALSALSAAHRAGIVHRDVKPHNLLLDLHGRVLLADFGIALVPSDDRKTRAGVAMGSFAYMPHEQRIDASKVGPAADIYATGATLYHLVTGESPVDLFLCADEPDHVRWSALPHALRPIVRRACAAKPSDRYESADAFAEALRAVRDGSTSLTFPDLPGQSRPIEAAHVKTIEAPAQTTLPDPPAPARNTGRIALAVLALPLLALGAAKLAQLTSAPAPQPPPVEPPEPVIEAPLPVVAPAAPEIAPEIEAPAAPPPRPRAPKPGPEAPPKPAPAASIPAASIPDVLGPWSGSLGGISFTLDLSGSASAITGTATSKLGDKMEQHPVIGRYDLEQSLLLLHEPEADGATYTLRPDGDRLRGEVSRLSRVQTIALRRSSP